MLKEKIGAIGHSNVSSMHKTTLEVTREDYLTPGGDCIIAVSADRSMQDFSGGFKDLLRRDDARIEITLYCAGLKEVVFAYGSRDLVLSHPTDLVVRKSSFICDRTLAIRADKAALDLDRGFVSKLSKGFRVDIELKVF